MVANGFLQRRQGVTLLDVAQQSIAQTKDCALPSCKVAAGIGFSAFAMQ